MFLDLKQNTLTIIREMRSSPDTLLKAWSKKPHFDQVIGTGVCASSSLTSIFWLQAVTVRQMEWHIQTVLNHDTAVISTLRCLQLYLERLGCHYLDQECISELAGRAFVMVTESVADIQFLNCRPSVIAAAILYAERRARGVIPFWPTMLAKLTGYQVGQPWPTSVLPQFLPGLSAVNATLDTLF